METIAAACISAAVTLGICLATNRTQAEKTRALMEYKLGELTREVRELTGFARRMPVLEEQIKSIHHRIADLERERGLC